MSLYERFLADGCLVLDDIFPIALIEEAHAEFVRQYGDLGGPHPADVMVVGSKRLQVPIEVAGPFLEPDFYDNPKLREFLSSALGGDYLIDSISCVTALPGAPGQHLHADHPDLFPERPGARNFAAPYAITVAIPLVDLTPETGTTRLLLNSHLNPASTREETPFSKRGDAFLMDYRLRHQGTENQSDAQRPIAYVVYSRPWFTDISNAQVQARINIRQDALSKIPDGSRHLFRRLAAKGALDRSQTDLFAATDEGADAQG